MARTLIKPGTLTRLQAQQEALMPDTCDIYHRTTTQNALRETVVSYPDDPDIASQPCRFTPPSRIWTDAERTEAAREGLRLDGRFAFATGTDVRQDDLIIFDGRRWVVAYVHPEHGYQTAQRVDVRLEEAP